MVGPEQEQPLRLRHQISRGQATDHDVAIATERRSKSCEQVGPGAGEVLQFFDRRGAGQGRSMQIDERFEPELAQAVCHEPLDGLLRAQVRIGRVHAEPRTLFVDGLHHCGQQAPRPLDGSQQCGAVVTLTLVGPWVGARVQGGLELLERVAHELTERNPRGQSIHRVPVESLRGQPVRGEPVHVVRDQPSHRGQQVARVPAVVHREDTRIGG